MMILRMSDEVIIRVLQLSSPIHTNWAKGLEKIPLKIKKKMFTSFIGFVSELGEGIDNQTEDDVQKDDINNNKEGDIDSSPQAIIFFFVITELHGFGYSSSENES
jgi:hypothetical protein